MTAVGNRRAQQGDARPGGRTRSSPGDADGIDDVSGRGQVSVDEVFVDLLGDFDVLDGGHVDDHLEPDGVAVSVRWTR
ncbi:hypothetical protein [Streptomyces sp. NBC_00154]|uniref:hypothetical protein n=1 Tax=Streptomyces sp. NBC_00154 TaxID=2975670 RepID=UPI002252144C|nr:hypothetical protein [Streptomyces sp. NBC_00154]